jgi:hypothetical protein
MLVARPELSLVTLAKFVLINKYAQSEQRKQGRTILFRLQGDLEIPLVGPNTKGEMPSDSYHNTPVNQKTGKMSNDLH